MTIFQPWQEIVNASMSNKTSRWKFGVGQNIYQISKYYPANYLLITVTSQWRHLADTTKTKWSKLMSPSWGKRAPCTSGEDTVALKMIQHPHCGFPVKMQNLKLIMKKYQTNLTEGETTKITGPYASIMSKACKTEKGWGIVPDESELSVMQGSEIHGHGSDPRSGANSYRRLSWDTWGSLTMDWGLDHHLYRRGTSLILGNLY